MSTSALPVSDATSSNSSVESVTEAAVALAHRWANETALGQTAQERRTSDQLRALVADPAGLDLAVRFVDRVARPEDVRVAAKELGRLAAAPGFLSQIDRLLLRTGANVARLAPAVVVPLARKRLRQLVGHLVVDAHDPALGEHLSRAAAAGQRLNINLLGEAVLGESEARSRADRTRALLARHDVDYISIKVSSLVSQISTWDTEGTTERVLDRLRPLFRTAAAEDAFINLDMEEYRDLDVTMEVFTRLLSEDEFTGLEAGIVLQAYLPDTVDALRHLIDFARKRRESGGASIKVRLVKGANLAMERVEAELHGWAQAPYPTKADVDANYVRLLDEALRPEVAAAVRIGVASHNLFDVALAHLLARARGVSAALDVEMLQGMAPAQARAVQSSLGAESQLILYTPVVDPADFDVAVSYLVRRLEENAAPENFLHALFAHRHGEDEPGRGQPRSRSTSGRPEPGALDAMADQEARFRVSVAARKETFAGRRREVVQTAADAPSADSEQSADSVQPAASQEFGVWFTNTPDSDPALPTTRRWAQHALAAPARELTSQVLTSTDDVDAVVVHGRSAGRTWAQVPPEERAAVLRTAADAIEARRDALLTEMAHEGGKTISEADPEVSEAIDFARFYADSVLEIAEQERSEGLRFTPYTLTLVTPPWNFPVAIPTGGMLAALGAGSAVVIKPAHATPGCVEIVVDAVHEALRMHGFDDAVLQVVRVRDRDVGRQLVSHEAVEAVLLTGSYETAAMFAEWRADHPGGPRVLAETSGKNALVVTPSADFDLAVADAVRSAFGHAGQKCSAASLLILVGSVGRSARFRRQLLDAVGSLRVGWPSDLAATMGPVIEAPTGKLRRALTSLDPGESWLVEPRELEDSRLWAPGLKEGVVPDSFFHRTECFGPVLGIMTADTLAHAIELQNGVDFGLTGGLHSLDEDEIEFWLDHVEVGNAYVNRHTTGAIVQRQSFGGWKRSVVGPGAKAGGPNYVAQLGVWTERHVELAKAVVTGRSSGKPHEASATSDRDSVGPSGASFDRSNSGSVGLTPAEARWLDAALASDAKAFASVFGVESDPSALRSEANLFRYRPISELTIRAGADSRPVQVLRVAFAAERVGVPVLVSVAPDVLDHVLHPRRLEWVLESDADFSARLERGEVHGRVRVIGDAGPLHSVLARAGATADATLLTGEVLISGRRELLTVLREQAISWTLHRFGHLPSQ